MTKQQYTALIHLKGWRVDEFLAYIGHGQSWYSDNTTGNEKAQLRLEMLIEALPINGE